MLRLMGSRTFATKNVLGTFSRNFSCTRESKSPNTWKSPSCKRTSSTSRYTTCYCIPTYAFPITAELRQNLLPAKSCSQLRPCSSKVIFYLLYQHRAYTIPDSLKPSIQIYCLHQCLYIFLILSHESFKVKVFLGKDCLLSNQHRLTFKGKPILLYFFCWDSFRLQYCLILFFFYLL